MRGSNLRQSIDPWCIAWRGGVGYRMPTHEALADLGIWEDTFYRWVKEIPKFTEAVKIGTQLSRMWWERQGRLSLRDKDFNHGLWYMNMKNRFGWTDRYEGNLTRDETLKVEVEYVNTPLPAREIETQPAKLVEAG